MAVKGFYDNPQEATVPANSDLLGIQTGTTLADMKKITYENLVKPLETGKLDKITVPTENAIVTQNADGTLKNSEVNITDPTFDSVGADEFDTGSQVVQAVMIPSTDDEMLKLLNTQAGKVHTIMELRSPDTGDTEATLSLHTVPNGIDDWVCDLSFHNYSTLMKFVSVISHFTGENAGSWEWVSRYTDGTDYSMIERMLMKLDGQTGYLLVGESGEATARIHVKQSGYLDKPAVLAEVDSSHTTQPEALQAKNDTNFAHTTNLVKFKLMNATDTGVVLKLENAGTGDYINADGKFVVDKDGNVTAPNLVKYSDIINDLTTGGIDKPLSAEQGKVLGEDIADHESRIAVLEHFNPLQSWADIQTACKEGVVSRYLKSGDLIETTYGGSPAIVEVVGINQDTPPAGTTNYKDVISFQFKDCLQNDQFSAPQALYNAVEGLAAGTYTFINSNDSLSYTFTIAQALPAGGVIVITSWGVATYEPTIIKTMQADRLTDIETDIAVTQASGGTALAPVNFTSRCRYGSNLYLEAAIRHFMNDNSDSYVWEAQGLYDMPSTYGAGGGFLKRIDSDLASVIGPVVKKVARATADGGGQDTIEDKVFLLSRVEMGYGTEGVTTGEFVYERWNGVPDSQRIKLLSGTPQDWWLRFPNVSNQNVTRRVDTDGALNSHYTYRSVGLAPGLAIY